MAKKPVLHPYSDRLSFVRIMLLIATLVQYPGIGEPEEQDEKEKGNHHNALELLQKKIQELAQEMGINFKGNYPAIHTIRKDLETLREYGILERRMYRWGYYLGTGLMAKEELKIAFEGLKSWGYYQGYPQVRDLYNKLSKRVRGMELENSLDFFYPVRQNITQVINYTNPEEMMAKKQNRHNLYHHLDKLEGAIVKGNTMEIYRFVDLYNDKQNSQVKTEIIWPLQLVYYEISWYLIHEKCANNQLAIARLDRFSDCCEVLPVTRGIAAQKDSLYLAYQLLENGWGLYLGEQEEQELELRQKLNFIPIKIRFYPPVSNFIKEGEKRHINQKITLGKKDPYTGRPSYLDYEISLPPRSFNEFFFWVQKYGANVEVIYPYELRQRHLEAALALINQYRK
jgi:predicted DNA-binding transcriptional regulator YafY